jgi:hypothetical protein
MESDLVRLVECKSDTGTVRMKVLLILNRRTIDGG